MCRLCKQLFQLSVLMFNPFSFLGVLRGHAGKEFQDSIKRLLRVFLGALCAGNISF